MKLLGHSPLIKLYAVKMVLYFGEDRISILSTIQFPSESSVYLNIKKYKSRRIL